MLKSTSQQSKKVHVEVEKKMKPLIKRPLFLMINRRKNVNTKKKANVKTETIVISGTQN